MILRPVLTPIQQQQMMQDYVRQQVGGNPQTVPMPGTRTLGGDLAQGSTWDEPTYVEGQGWETSGDFQRAYPGRGYNTDTGDLAMSRVPPGADPGMDEMNPQWKGSQAWREDRDMAPFLPNIENPRLVKQISDQRLDLTPRQEQMAANSQRLSSVMQEQQAMQDYVRQRMAAGLGPQQAQAQQLNLDLPQQPVDPRFQAQMMPPPTLPGQGPPPAPMMPPGLPPGAGSYGVGSGPQLDVSQPSGGPPGLSYGAGYAPGRPDRGGEPFNAQMMYRKNIPF